MLSTRIYPEVTALDLSTRKRGGASMMKSENKYQKRLNRYREEFLSDHRKRRLKLSWKLGVLLISGLAVVFAIGLCSDSFQEFCECVRKWFSSWELSDVISLLIGLLSGCVPILIFDRTLRRQIADEKRKNVFQSHQLFLFDEKLRAAREHLWSRFPTWFNNPDVVVQIVRTALPNSAEDLWDKSDELKIDVRHGYLLFDHFLAQADGSPDNIQCAARNSHYFHWRGLMLSIAMNLANAIWLETRPGAEGDELAQPDRRALKKHPLYPRVVAFFSADEEFAGSIDFDPQNDIVLKTLPSPTGGWDAFFPELGDSSRLKGSEETAPPIEERKASEESSDDGETDPGLGAR